MKEEQCRFKPIPDFEYLDPKLESQLELQIGAPVKFTTEQRDRIKNHIRTVGCLSSCNLFNMIEREEFKDVKNTFDIVFEDSVVKHSIFRNMVEDWFKYSSV